MHSAMAHGKRITINMRFFAYFREITGESHLPMEIEIGATVDDLIDILCTRYPALERHRKEMLVSVNHNYARGSETLKDGDEVAVFPPLSGG